MPFESLSCSYKQVLPSHPHFSAVSSETSDCVSELDDSDWGVSLSQGDPTRVGGLIGATDPTGHSPSRWSLSVNAPCRCAAVVPPPSYASSRPWVLGLRLSRVTA